MQLHCNDILWQKKKNQCCILAHQPHSCKVSWKGALSNRATLTLLQEVIVPMPQLWGNESGGSNDSFNFISWVIFFYLSEEGECYETTLTFNVKTSLMLPCALLDVSFLPLCFHSLNKKQTTNKQNTFTNLSLSFSFFCVYVWEKTGVNMKRFCVFVLFL